MSEQSVTVLPGSAARQTGSTRVADEPWLTGRYRSDKLGARKPAPTEARSSNALLGRYFRPSLGLVALPVTW